MNVTFLGCSDQFAIGTDRQLTNEARFLGDQAEQQLPRLGLPDFDRALRPSCREDTLAIGVKDGWNRLKKNIKAELNEDLLEQFHGTLSLPFNAGENKRIAVKIVDDRGIESLKIVSLDD